MKRILALYLSGISAVALAIAFPFLSWLSPMTFVLIFPLAAIWIWKSEGRSLWDLGFRFSGGWLSFLGIGLVFGLAIPVLFQIIQVLGGWITLTPGGVSVGDWISSFPLVFLKMVFIVAIEEFVFRGFFFQALNQRIGVRWAVVMSSLLWGIGHLASMAGAGLPPGLIIIGMTTFLLWGITLSLGYLKTNKSLWLPYGLHLGINLSFSFSVFGLFYSIQPNAPQWWIGHPPWMPESGLIGIIVWLILALIIYFIPGINTIKKFAAS